MGLFSFLKNAGAKLLGRDAEANDAAKAAEAAGNLAEANAAKANLISSVISSSGISVDDLAVEFSEDVATLYGTAHSADDREKLILVAGNIEGVAAVDDRLSVVPTSVFYDVKPGDSLSKIAKEVYGDAMRYNEIFEANKPMLKSVDLIYPGQKLRIPNA